VTPNIKNGMSAYTKITNTKVLVTGGAGFLPGRQAGIGFNLYEVLLKTNNQVIPPL
jgi:short-subunit dehydrogenase involved in D-alanine esterification of teichoic acids